MAKCPHKNKLEMKLKCVAQIVFAIPLVARQSLWSSRYAKAIDVANSVWLLMAFDRETAALLRRSNDDAMMGGAIFGFPRIRAEATVIGMGRELSARGPKPSTELPRGMSRNPTSLVGSIASIGVAAECNGRIGLESTCVHRRRTISSPPRGNFSG